MAKVGVLAILLGLLVTVGCGSAEPATAENSAELSGSLCANAYNGCTSRCGAQMDRCDAGCGEHPDCHAACSDAVISCTDTCDAPFEECVDARRPRCDNCQTN